MQLIFTDKHRLTIDFYGENIFRAFEDTSGGIVRNPEALPPANILVENPRRPAGQLTINDGSNNVTIASAKIIIERKLLKKNGWFILEHTPAHNFEKEPMFKSMRNYGTTVFSIFINKNN